MLGAHRRALRLKACCHVKASERQMFGSELVVLQGAWAKDQGARLRNADWGKFDEDNLNA